MAFFCALSTIGGSVPVQRARHLPEASQKAKPNLIPDTELTRVSWMRSTDLRKRVWPRSSGAIGFLDFEAAALDFYRAVPVSQFVMEENCAARSCGVVRPGCDLPADQRKSPPRRENPHPKREKAEVQHFGSGKTWRQPTLAEARQPLPSARRRLTAVFGMETGRSAALWPPKKI